MSIVGADDEEEGQTYANLVPVPGFGVAYAGLQEVADLFATGRTMDPAYVARRTAEGASMPQIGAEWLLSLGIYGAPVPLVPPKVEVVEVSDPSALVSGSQYAPIGPVSARLQQAFARQALVEGSTYDPVGPVSARLQQRFARDAQARSSPPKVLIAVGVVGALGALAWWFLKGR